MALLRIEPAPPSTTEKGRALEARIERARGAISPLYRVLLNSQPVADGWESLLTVIRQKTSLKPLLRELVILRVAVLNRADYEFEAHIPHARRAGITEMQLAGVRSADFSAFNRIEKLVLNYTDVMTTDIQVPNALFARVKAAFNPASLVDLTATIAAYNMVSRFVVALDVH